MLKRFSYLLGSTVRETALALDRVGCRLQGNYAFREQLCRHRRIMGLYDVAPQVAQDVFVAPNATVIGNVNLAEGSSVWYGAVLRGDVNQITVGNKSSIGNRTIVHVSGHLQTPAPTKIGDRVLVGDGAVLHGCTLEDDCRVEDGAVVYDGVVVGKNSVVAPGAVVPSGKILPPGTVWAGNPAKQVGSVSEAPADFVAKVEKRYNQSRVHLEQAIKPFHEKEADLISEDYYRDMRPGTRSA